MGVGFSVLQERSSPHHVRPHIPLKKVIMAAPATDSKSSFVDALVSSGVLSFGQYTLKSGRQSPYFITTTRLHSAPLLNATAAACADVLMSPPFAEPVSAPPSASDSSATTSTPKFDILFGPAYKGIPLCTATVNELGARSRATGNGVATNPWSAISYAFNRKEAKRHGEGGNIIGAPLRGCRVVIFDDVITAGTALREAVDLIAAEGGQLVGVVVLMDRQERLSEEEPRSALRVAETQVNVPVRALVGLADVVEVLGERIGPENLQRLRAYREIYGCHE